jgi:hypothetical protein
MLMNQALAVSVALAATLLAGATLGPCKKKSPDEGSATTNAAKTRAKGDKVDVKWNNSWWKGEILEVKGDKFKIHYTGWASSWDEEVTADRLRDPTAESKAGSGTDTAASASASASAAPVATVAPFDDGDDKSTQAKLKDDAERDKKGALALAKVNVDAKADVSVAPKDGVYGNIQGHLTTLDDVSMTYSSSSGTWSFRAAMGGKVNVGPSVSFKEADVGQKKFTKALKYGDGYFQMPGKDVKTWPLKEFKESTSMNSENAYSFEFTKFQPGTYAKPGACSGKVTIFYQLPKEWKGPLWATGTFKNIKCNR